MVLTEHLGIEKVSKIGIDNKTTTLNVDGLRSNIPRKIVIHATNNYPSFESLLETHRARGFAGVGYHFFVSENNKIYQARPILLEGAHALGFNTHSLGIGLYMPPKKIVRSRIKITRDLIEELKVNYSLLGVISHTQAQVEYLNKVLKEAGYDKQFLITEDLTEERSFQLLKREVDTFLGCLSTEKDQKLKSYLKALKNCPGPLFREFR